MAHFITRIRGNRGGATRLGTKNSGASAEVCGWNLGASCIIAYNEELDRDEVSVSITRGSGYGSASNHIGTWYLNEKTGKYVKTRR